MNYIPGFSNYLQAAVPRYARGGRVMDGERMVYDEPMMYDGYDMGGYGDGDTRGYSEPYQYTPPLEQYMPVEQPMMYDMGGYNELPYGGGGMLAEPVEQPYLPAVQPMTQEVAAPYVAPLEQVAQMPAELTYEDREARRIAANTPPPGTSIVGPYAGKKGLSFGDDNTFDIYDEQEVRVVDGKGNVIFTGIGVEGAKQAVAVGQSLSNDLGKNANFRIQKGERTIVDGSVGPNRYIDVAYAAPSQSGLGFLADTVLPFAASFIPVIGPVAGAALGSAASSGLQGRSLEDALKKAAIAAATAGAVKVSGLDTTIGGALSNAAPQAAGQVAGQVAEQAVGGAGDIVVSGLSKALQSAGGALGSAALSQAANAGLSEVTGYKPPAEKFAEQPLPETFQPPVDMHAGVEPIVVSGDRFASGSGLPFGSAVSIPVNEILSGALTAAQPAPVEQPVTQEPEEIVVTAPKAVDPLAGIVAPIATEFLPTGALPSQQPVTPPAPEPTLEEILVEARKPYVSDVPVTPLLPEILRAIEGPPVEDPTIVVTGAEKPTIPTEALAAVPVVGGLAAATGSATPNVVNGIDQATGDIVVEAPQSVSAPPPIAGIETAMPAITQGALTPAQTAGTPPSDQLTLKDIADYLRLAGLTSSLLGGLGGSGKGGGSGGTIPAGMGGLSSLFSKQLPPSTLPGGGGGGALPASTLATQGLRSPQDYYRYGYGPEQSFFSYATQGAPNTSRAYTGYEGSTAEDMFAPQPSGLPQPITTPIPNNPAGPSMYAPDVDSMRFALGGSAVEGAGDGRDDKIPALLSDGEYVIDAETVALLGNGSNKAGAELLDSFRVNVRKQKGKKLARGEFSDNAKRPEHYMAGGQA
jgi:hypothetical protein